MCDPFTILAAVGTAAGAGLSGAGSIMSGRAANKSAKIMAGIMRDNADLAGQEGAFNEARIRDDVGRVEGAQTAAYAANGLDPAFGSPAIVQAWTAMQGEQDALMARAQGQTKRADYLQQAAGLVAKGHDALTAGNIGLVGSLLQGATKIFGMASGGGGGGAGAAASSAVDLSKPFASTWHR